MQPATYGPPGLLTYRHGETSVLHGETLVPAECEQLEYGEFAWDDERHWWVATPESVEALTNEPSLEIRLRKVQDLTRRREAGETVVRDVVSENKRRAASEYPHSDLSTLVERCRSLVIQIATITDWTDPKIESLTKSYVVLLAEVETVRDQLEEIDSNLIVIRAQIADHEISRARTA